MPVGVERADHAGRLIEVRARRAVGDDAGGAAQPELERDVAEREGLAAPVDERDRARSDRGGRGAAARPRRRRPAAPRDRRPAGTPPIEDASKRCSPASTPSAPSKRQPSTRHLLDRDVLQAESAELLGRVLGGGAVLGRAGGAEAERARAEAGEVLDGRAQLRLVDRQLASPRESFVDAWRVGGKTRHAERPGPSMRRPYLRPTTGTTPGMDEVPGPEYSRDDVTTGVVHFGVGGFHRAHMAMYHDRLMNEGKALDWGICGVGVMEADAEDARRPARPGRPLHAGRQALRRLVGRADDRLAGRVPVRARRPRGGDREARRAGDADRLADRHRGRLQPRRHDRRVRRGRPGGGGRPRGGRAAEDGVRARDRGAAAPARARDRAVHGDVVRQPAGQRQARAHGVHRLRPPARRGARRLDRARTCAFPNGDGRPHHARDDRRGRRGGALAVRGRGPLAGRVRAVHPVGARGRVQRRAAAVRGRRRAGRRRRRAVRADEAAAAQREPPGDRATSATCAATGSCTTPRRTRCSATCSRATWTRRRRRRWRRCRGSTCPSTSRR